MLQNAAITSPTVNPSKLEQRLYKCMTRFATINHAGTNYTRPSEYSSISSVLNKIFHSVSFRIFSMNICTSEVIFMVLVKLLCDL